MSDTPRTDAAELPISTNAVCCGHVPAEFARALEKEASSLRLALERIRADSSPHSRNYEVATAALGGK